MIIFYFYMKTCRREEIRETEEIPEKEIVY